MKHQNSVRFYEIDLLRFLAALGVVLFHYTFAETQNGHLPFHFSISAWTKYGYFGVMLFFMISGFVILMTALHRNWRGFVKSRFVRLYPMYWIAVALTFTVVYIAGYPHFKATFTDLLWNLTMVQGYLLKPNLDEVYWTLGVEMMFYAHIFLLLYFKKIRHIFGYLVFLLITSLFFNTYHVKLINIPFFPEYSPYFVAGAVAYLAHRSGWSRKYLLLYLSAYLLSLYSIRSRIDSLSGLFHTHYSMPAVYLILTLFFILFGMISLDKTSILRFKSFLYMGVLTYPLYLVHDRIGIIWMEHLSKSIADPSLLVAGMASFMIIFAYLLHKLIEQPTSALAKKLLDRVL